MLLIHTVAKFLLSKLLQKWLRVDFFDGLIMLIQTILGHKILRSHIFQHLTKVILSRRCHQDARANDDQISKKNSSKTITYSHLICYNFDLWWLEWNTKCQNSKILLSPNKPRSDDFSWSSALTGLLGRIQSTSMLKLNCSTIISYTKQECSGDCSVQVFVLNCLNNFLYS